MNIKIGEQRIIPNLPHQQHYAVATRITSRSVYYRYHNGAYGHCRKDYWLGLHRKEDEKWKVVYYNGIYTVCTENNSPITSTNDKEIADLVAAAPLLLKELKHLVRLMEPGFDIPGLSTLNGARRAISTAEGIK